MTRRHSAPRPGGWQNDREARRRKKTSELPAISPGDQMTRIANRHSPITHFLLDYLQSRLAAVGRRSRRGGFRGCGCRGGRGFCCGLAREDEPLSVLLGEDAGHGL